MALLLVDVMTFGHRLKDLRERLGLSQGDLADQLDVSRATISLWERDMVVSLPPGTINQLADVLQTPVTDLLRAAGYAVESSGLTEDEAELLALYRRISTDDRWRAPLLLRALTPPPAPRHRRGPR
jgi:transcriptional regulator with XRE-family HTH domain